MENKIEALLNESTSFLLSTTDDSGFPNTIVVSQPVIRNGFHNLKFCIDGVGETVKNIRRNNRGSVCCYQESSHESLLLKGLLTIEDIKDFKSIESKLTAYQKILNHKEPVIVSLEVLTARIHTNGKTSNIHI